MTGRRGEFVVSITATSFSPYGRLDVSRVQRKEPFSPEATSAVVDGNVTELFSASILYIWNVRAPAFRYVKTALTKAPFLTLPKLYELESKMGCGPFSCSDGDNAEKSSLVNAQMLMGLDVCPFTTGVA